MMLVGDVAVVTGAARGNGLAIASGLAASGAAVALTDIDEAALQQAVDGIVAQGGRAIGFALDVTDAAACAQAASRVERELGPVSILVNNAGILRIDPLDSPSFEPNWNATFRTNVDGCINMVRALVEQLRRTGGRIVNVASTASFLGSAKVSAYVASKGAVMQMTKSLAAELGPQGIRVNALAPGRIATAMTASYRDDPQVKATYLARTPLGRYGEAVDLVGPTIFLVSSMSAYVSGAILPVDGGYVAV